MIHRLIRYISKTEKINNFFQKRELNRLADTPEFTNARETGQVRRPTPVPSTTQPRRNAASKAPETISQHIKDLSTKTSLTVDQILAIAKMKPSTIVGIPRK